MADPDFSKIKNIFIPLFNYRIDHGPSSKNRKNQNFTGRGKIIKRLHLLFSKEKQRNSDTSPNGAYLVTGYRGMGKTSVVREAFNDHVEEEELKTWWKRLTAERENSFKKKNELAVFNFALSQDEVHDIDLLRQIGLEIIRYSREEILRKSGLKILSHSVHLRKSGISAVADRIFIFLLPFFFKLFAFLISLNLAFYFFMDHVDVEFVCNPFEMIEGVKDFLPTLFNKDESIGKVFLFFGAFAIIFTFINLLASKGFNAITDLFNFRAKLKENLSLFEKRLYASVKQEDRAMAGINLGSTSPFTTIANRILSVFQNTDDDSFNSTLNYSIASPKEIEHYLSKTLGILDDIRKFRKKSRIFENVEDFIFIVDELDKIEPDYFFAPGDRESNAHLHHNDMPFHITTKARKRQEAIAKLLANLKNFLTDVKARFIFIGGRDMYDASLADISDRESFYSSIFNEVIYVETFFKDKISPNAGLSQLAERYVFNFLIPEKIKGNFTLKEYLDRVNTNSKDEQFKILHLLQNFFIFLLYRSNGSPKKLIELIERYVVRFDESQIDDTGWDNYVVKLKAMPNLKVDDKKENEVVNDLALRFSFRDQYEINLTSNLYRPYTIINSKHLKNLGDKLLYSSAFLMDHILKFHRTAFSWRNLEMIPDIILANKEPNFRQFFQEVIEFLSKQHIRQTLNAIFQYKFHNRVKNELEYLSKTSEFSSAAFNFTLDESFHLKSYYKKKLAAKYLEYRQAANETLSSEYVNSIGYLHGIIGDLHYYDEEYDDAIIHYTDAVQGLRHRINAGKALLNHQFVLFCRNQLSLGLCLEKMHSYDKAYSVFRNLIIHAQDFNKGKEKSDKEPSIERNWERPYKRIQLFLRPHIALLGIIEKQRNDGITYDNLVRNIHEYSKFLNDPKTKLFPSKQNHLFDYSQMNQKGDKAISTDKKRKITLFTDYYVSVGNMLFYKNQLFYRMVFDTNRIDKEAVTIKIADKIREGTPAGKDYFPSHASYIYYLHALTTFNTPFHENFNYFLSQNEEDEKKGEETNFAATAHNRELSLTKELLFLKLFLRENERYSILNAKQNETVANILGKIGDALLSSLHEVREESGVAFMEIFRKEEGLKNLFDKLENGLNPFSIEMVGILYKLSNEFYYKAGNLYEASFQIKKTLYVVRDCIGHFKEKPTPSSIKKLAQVALNDLSAIAKGSNRAQISKYRSFTNQDQSFTSNIYKGVSTEPDVKEIVVLVETIRMKLSPDHFPKLNIGCHNTISSMFTRIVELKLKTKINLRQIIKIGDLLNPRVVLKAYLNIRDKKGKEGLEEVFKHALKEFYNGVANEDFEKKWKASIAIENKIFDRNEFKTTLRGNYNHSDFDEKWDARFSLTDKYSNSDKWEFKKFLKEAYQVQYTENKWATALKINDKNWGDDGFEFEKALKNLFESSADFIVDGLFCNAQLIRILNTYGISYMLNYSFVASVHSSMALFSVYSYLIQNIGGDLKESFDKKVIGLIGENTEMDFDPFYHYDLSLQHYNKAREVHSEGKLYKEIIRELYTLDDDLNDNLTHFCAAIERFRINMNDNGEIIKSIEKFLDKSHVRIYDNYIT